MNDQQLQNETLRQLEYPEVLNIISCYCYSDPGRELLLSHKPTDHLNWLKREIDLTGEMLDVFTLDDPLPFDGLTDIKTKIFKSMVAGAALNAGELLSVAEFMRASRLFKSYFKIRKDKYPLVYEDSELLHDNRMLEKHISEAIDETGNVRDTASRELARIRHEINEKSARLRNRIQKILKKVSDEDLVQEEFISLREGRFVLPVKAENKRQIPGIIHGVSQTGATVFMEPSEIIEMNNELSLLNNEEKREILRILTNLTAEVGVDAKDILRSAEVLAHIDSLFAKAKFAADFGGIKPQITEDNMLYLRNVRHPLLVKSKGAKKVIPLSIEFTDKLRGHLISGPNAGGKTVALKSIGINIALALSGIFPLGECRTNYRTMYSLIGDHQSIAADLSTFSSQIIKLKDILDNCTADSLILVDEIGSGTDPQEGGALAAGVLDTFLELKLFFVATTHHSSLKTYALTRQEIKNDSLEFDDKKLVPTYKFLEGIPGNSYAFVLAESVGLSRLVLDRAKNYLGSRQTELEESIRILQKYKFEAEQLKIENEQEKLKSEKIRKDYEQRLNDIKLKKSHYLSEAKNEAEEILRRSNALVENTVREIRESRKEPVEIKRVYEKKKQEIRNELKSVAGKLKESAPVQTSQFNPGDSVTTENSPTVGTVMEIYDNGESALVEFNGLKFKMETSGLILSDSLPESPKGSTDYIRFDAKTSIDLRGMRAEEALRDVEEFISAAILGNAQNLTIIHGKGTGALRHAIHEYLSHHPSVTRFRLGEIVEGGAGVTIVEI